MRNLVLSTVAALALVGVSGVALADATANSSSSAGSNAGAAAVTGPQNQGQGQSLTFAPSDNSRFEDNSKTNAEPAIAPNLAGLVATPATCMGSATASGAGGGIFAFGIGGTYRDKECERREALKLAAHLGLNSEAQAIFYSLEAVQEALGAPEASARRESTGVTVNTRNDVASASRGSDSPYLLHRIMR